MTEIQRIKKVINWLIFQEKISSQRELAEKMGYTESSMSQILNEKVSLSENFIKKLSIMDDAINEDWLFAEKGEMLKNNQQIENVSNSTVVGANVNGNGNNITHNDFAGMIELQKGYQEMIKTSQAQLTESQSQMNRLIAVIEQLHKKDE